MQPWSVHGHTGRFPMGHDRDDLIVAHSRDGRVATAALAIPTVSEWGLVVMTLLVLTAGTLVLARARAQWKISARVVEGGAYIRPRVYDAIADHHKKEAKR